MRLKWDKQLGHAVPDTDPVDYEKMGVYKPLKPGDIQRAVSKAGWSWEEPRFLKANWKDWVEEIEFKEPEEPKVATLIEEFEAAVRNELSDVAREPKKLKARGSESFDQSLAIYIARWGMEWLLKRYNKSIAEKGVPLSLNQVVKELNRE